VHLESGGDDRLRTAQLSDVLADQARRATERAVIGGDFNNQVALQSFMFRGLASNGFADALTSATDRRTSINHQHPIDWIFVKGVTARDGHVARVEETSDHYPVVAAIALRLAVSEGSVGPISPWAWWAGPCSRESASPPQQADGPIVRSLSPSCPASSDARSTCPRS
jgi:hypothetical protein